MKDKVKRRRILNQRKIRDIYKQINYNNGNVDLNNDINIERQRQLIEKQQNEYDNIALMKLKLKLMRKKSKELNKVFLKTKRKDYKSLKEFLIEYKNVKTKRKEVINKYALELKNTLLTYSEKYETIRFKIKRWFFGMGKEFFRIRWSSKKSLLFNFITVVSICVVLAIIFFIVDAIFSII